MKRHRPRYKIRKGKPDKWLVYFWNGFTRRYDLMFVKDSFDEALAEVTKPVKVVSYIRYLP